MYNKHHSIEINQNDNEQQEYLIFFEENLKKELINMIDNDHNKPEKKKKPQGLMICKPKFSKETIEKNISFEMLYNEIPSRSIIIGNIPEGTTENDIKYILCEFGDYQTCELDHLKEGKVTVRFYNLLDAMMMRSSSIYIQFRSIIMSFGTDIPIDNKKKPPNNGTIVVFNLPEMTTDIEIHSIFGKFGQIREIRKTPNKRTQRFVEFYDSRSAFKAKKEMKKKKLLISGKYCQINVEFSLPGNYRVNYEKFYKNYIPTIQRRVVTRAN